VEKRNIKKCLQCLHHCRRLLFVGCYLCFLLIYEIKELVSCRKKEKNIIKKTYHASAWLLSCRSSFVSRYLCRLTIALTIYEINKHVRCREKEKNISKNLPR
jgi:hypothetical protein